MADHAHASCKACGQTDDHPKVLTPYPGEDYHHDCLPFGLRAQVTDNPLTAEVVKACEGGKKGDALRKHIAKLHETQEG